MLAEFQQPPTNPTPLLKLSELTGSFPYLEAESRGNFKEAYLEQYLTNFGSGIVIPSIFSCSESIGITFIGNRENVQVFSVT